MKVLTDPQSGSQAGTTASRNRFGQYYRTRATPVNPNTTAQGAVRNRLSVNSAAWRQLSDVQRSGWNQLGGQLVRTDALGQAYTLTGFQAYLSVNNNHLAAGNAVVGDAPAVETPEGLYTATITLTASALSVAFTPTPLATGVRLFVYASPGRSAGRSFEGDMRLIHVSAAALASPSNAYASYQGRFGNPVVGQAVFFAFHTYELGFLSGPLSVKKIVA